MRVAPLIHTRTYSCDFNSEFLIRPDIFMDADIKWARKNILGATASIDGLQGVRWVIADNGKYRIAGVVGFLKTICYKCNLSEELLHKSSELFCDDKGRLVYAFIGVVIDKNCNDFEFGISCDYLWSLYIDMVYPLWKRTYQEVITRPFEEVAGTKQVNSVPIKAEVIGGKELFESNDVFDYQLFLQILNDSQKRNFTFCSNQKDYNVIRNCEFNIITTSQNNITRMKRMAQTDFDVNKGTTVPNSESFVKTAQIDNTDKKKHLLHTKICLMTSIFIILIFILLWVKSK